jgi:hypothetical protein
MNMNELLLKKTVIYKKQDNKSFRNTLLTIGSG